MSKIHSVIVVLVISGFLQLVLASCKFPGTSDVLQPQPIAVPSPPYPPTAPTFSSIRPTVPGRKQSTHEVTADRFELRGHPKQFPVTTKDIIVVSVPAQIASAEADGSARTDSGMASPIEHQLRFAAILGFLKAGFRVKDAGVIETSTLTMQRYPATETEASVHVETAITENVHGIEQSTQRTTRTNAPRDDRWLHRGMHLILKDPTSLWAPELVTYQKLKADYFLRIFDLTYIERMQRVVAKRYVISETEAARFLAELENYNAQVEVFNEEVRKYNEELAAYKLQWRTYKAQFDTVMTQIRNNKRQVSHQPFLGVSVKSSPSGRGVTVLSVTSGSTAESVLKKGDKILAIDTMDINSFEHLVAVIGRRQASDTVSIHFIREGVEQIILATLDSYEGTNTEPPIFAPMVQLEPMALIEFIDEHTLDARRQERFLENVPMTFAEIRAEVIMTESGEVAWAGQFSVVANPDTTNLDTILMKMAEQLSKSSHLTQDPQDETLE